METILIRYGEIALKGGNRRFFVQRLENNIRDCLRAHGLEGKVKSVWGRIYVETSDVDEALEHLPRVFGIVSLSPVESVAADMDVITETALDVAREIGLSRDQSFRVQARRADKSFPVTSPEIGRIVGQRIVDTLSQNVDLSDEADITIGIEIRPEGAQVFAETIPGPGGLPLGSSGRAIALISGGIDSPVAAWMMMKRGCGIIPVHFRQSEVESSKALANCEVLASWSYGWDIRPIVMDHEETFGNVYTKLQQIGAARWTCVFCKRSLMLKAAEIADDHNAHAIVTGESVGQVASQTVENLEAISYGVPKPILRPLIGFDKIDITNLAKEIGTFQISTRDSAACPYLPASPMTTARMSDFREVLAALEERDV
jgi:thiamine biosynthesis protein ThiI